MTEPTTGTKRPPKDAAESKPIVVHLPGFRVKCRNCRHQSGPLTGNARAVEVVTGCTCWNPDLVLVLTFPNSDVELGLDTFHGDNPTP